MNVPKMIIEDSILKAYIGNEKVVVVPEGVKTIGGTLEGSDRNRRELIGDPIGYKAFFNNDIVEIVYLPDSTEEIGFKSFEHCKNLKVLRFSSNMKKTNCNSLLGCDKLKVLIFNGEIKQLDEIDFDWFGGKLDLELIYCNDGIINFHRDFFIEEYAYTGTMEDWKEKMSGHWIDRRTRIINCSDGTICH